MNPSSGKPELMMVGGDDKVAIDNGNFVLGPPGDDVVSIVDIGTDPLAPKIIANLRDELAVRAANQGIFVGISSGATFGVAMKIAAKAQPGSVILAMLPDTGERYLTTPLFEGIAEDMTDEERAISKSTPGYQMP